MYNYRQPQYVGFAQTFFPFAEEFGDNETMFFTLKYRINKGYFKSRLSGNPFYTNRTFAGRDVLGGLPVDKSKYRLIWESIEPQDFYDEITETYGYENGKTYSTFSVQSVSQAGVYVIKSKDSYTVEPKAVAAEVETRTTYTIAMPAITPRSYWGLPNGNETSYTNGASKYNSVDGKMVLEDSLINQDLTFGLWRKDVKLSSWR